MLRRRPRRRGPSFLSPSPSPSLSIPQFFLFCVYSLFFSRSTFHFKHMIYFLSSRPSSSPPLSEARRMGPCGGPPLAGAATGERPAASAAAGGRRERARAQSASRRGGTPCDAVASRTRWRGGGGNFAAGAESSHKAREETGLASKGRCVAYTAIKAQWQVAESAGKRATSPLQREASIGRAWRKNRHASGTDEAREGSIPHFLKAAGIDPV